MTESTVRRKASLWLAIVFVLGAALGGVLGYAFAHRSYAATTVQLTAEQRRAQKRAQLVQEVGLSGDQQRQITSILDQAHEEFQAIHAASDPQFDAVRQKTRDKIRQLLTAEQKPKFEEFVRKLDEERKRFGQ